MIMVYLLVSLMAAFAMSLTAYSVTGSVLLSLVAYTGTGVLHGFVKEKMRRSRTIKGSIRRNKRSV